MYVHALILSSVLNSDISIAAGSLAKKRLEMSQKFACAPSRPTKWSLSFLFNLEGLSISTSFAWFKALWKPCDVFSKICRAGCISLAISWPVPPQSEPLQQFHQLAPCRFWSRTAATTITNAQWIWQRQQQQQANNNKKHDDKDNDNENSSSYSLSIHKLQCPQVEQEGDMLPEGETSICKFPFAVPVAPSVVGNQCSWGDLRSYSGPVVHWPTLLALISPSEGCRFQKSEFRLRTDQDDCNANIR